MKTYLEKRILYFYIFIFLIISYLSIYKSSYLLNKNLYNKQLIWYFIGIIIIYLIKKIDIKKIYKLSFYLYIINIFLLIGLFFFGTSINGSLSWYYFFGISLQPSEFMKISLILLNSCIINKYLSKKDKKNEFKGILLLLLVLLIPSIITFKEPDTGAVISYFIITISMLLITNIDKNWLKGMFFIVITTLLIFFCIYFSNKNLFIDIFGSNYFYRIDRIINWHQKSGMQLNNSLIAIGSSGIIGHNYIPLYYPESETDFIFTSFSSTYGLLGGSILIVVVFSFDLYLLNLIKKEPKMQNKYVIFGILSLFFYQQVQSIAMTLGLLPITGITLPLISYGGSSLLSYLILIGIILNIRKI